MYKDVEAGDPPRVTYTPVRIIGVVECRSHSKRYQFQKLGKEGVSGPSYEAHAAGDSVEDERCIMPKTQELEAKLETIVAHMDGADGFDWEHL